MMCCPLISSQLLYYPHNTSLFQSSRPSKKTGSIIWQRKGRHWRWKWIKGAKANRGRKEWAGGREKVEEGSQWGRERGLREGLGVEAVSKTWTNSNKNRVSNATHLHRAGVLIMTHFHFLTESDWTLRFKSPIPVVRRQTEVPEHKQSGINSPSVNTVILKTESDNRWLRHMRSDSVCHAHSCTHFNHIQYICTHVLRHSTPEHQCTSRVTLTAATGTEEQDNHFCFLFFWKWNYVKGNNAGCTKYWQLQTP